MTDVLLQTPQQFLESNPAFKLGGLRNILFYREVNGLVSSGAVCSIGRKLLINVPKFLEWIATNPNTRGDKNAR